VNFRPWSDWILVKFDPLRKRSDIIEIAGDGDTSVVRTGTVVQPGPGRITKKGTHAPMDVQVGDRITFLRWHQEHRPGKANSETLKRMSAELGEDLTLIRQGDILFMFDGDITVDVTGSA